MKFLLDENAHQGLVRFLKEKGHEPARGPKGLSNGEVLALAIKEGRILITHDMDFSLDAPRFNHPGTILIRILPKDFADIKESLTKSLSEKTSHEAFANRLFLVFKDRYDEFPFRSEEFEL